MLQDGQPLADAIRPQSLDDVVGQEHILGEGKVLRTIIDSGLIPNLVFYGPSGTGKTTVANLIAKRTNRTLHRLNATTASIADIRSLCDQIDTMLAPNGVLLYLDEIQYFNKKQQQSLLDFIETGKIVLIASTTENPYFAVYNAILSRCTVFEFRPVSAAAVEQAVTRAFARAGEALGTPVLPEDGVSSYVAAACGGDVRKAVNAVELLASAGKATPNGILVTLEAAREVAQRSAMRYDRDGDEHYDILSALQKSLRGSDADAALHYLARLLAADDLLSACRRIVVCACEDVGLAHPAVIPQVKACVDIALQVGLPEARIPLADAVILICSAPKSNSGICAIDAAMGDVQRGKGGPIPDSLRDGHYGGAQKMGHAIGYRYAHDYPNHYVPQQYLPDALLGTQYYQYGDNKLEQQNKAYWDAVKRSDGKE